MTVRTWTLWISLSVVAGAPAPARPVTFETHPHRIDVRVGETLFTSYRFEADPDQPLVAPGRRQTKPVLWPLLSPSGVVLTRAYPFAAVAGESNDHPHHMGLYVTVDIGEDKFWGNSQTERPTIQHVKVLEQTPGEGQGRLTVLLYWIDRRGRVLLRETRRMTFRDEADQGQFVLDLDLTWTAADHEVRIPDTKEGLVAVRVAPWLREVGGTGRYLNALGAETEANVWGRRSPWMRLEGRHAGGAYGLVILNHADSLNYPTFWHARGYGCFSANPLGQGAFQRTHHSPDAHDLNLTLQPGRPVRFRFRVIAYEGPRTRAGLAQSFAAYLNEP